MYRRRLPLNPYSFAVILIILVLLAIFQTFVKDNSNSNDVNITIIEETNDSVTVEFNND